MTVAPRMPIARYSAPSPGSDGTKPAAIEPHWGLDRTISTARHPPTVMISATMNASIILTPRLCRKRIRSVSKAVTTTPARRGRPNSSCSPMAEPSTSARSQAAIAISHTTHSTHETGRLNIARHACARSIPATIPSRAERLCSRIAITLDMSRTQISA